MKPETQTVLNRNHKPKLSEIFGKATGAVARPDSSDLPVFEVRLGLAVLELAGAKAAKV